MFDSGGRHRAGGKVFLLVLFSGLVFGVGRCCRRRCSFAWWADQSAGSWEAWQLGAMVLIGTVAGFGGLAALVRANQPGTTGPVSVVGYIIPIVE